MKPIYIEMKAFGSYQDEKISFDKVDHGLFLITGDTGSGKTTIFDAIAYALFGKTSGGNRESAMMRSQYSPDGIKTEVTFQFLYDNKIYTVKRWPKQPKFKKVKDEDRYEQLKGDIGAGVELTLEDGTQVLGSNDEINNKIKEIIGLDAEQFTQIAMLAQGDFMKLLLASSDKRKEIFAKIFDTRIYEKIQYELKNRFNKLFGELEDNKKDITRELERIKCIESSRYGDDWTTRADKGYFTETEKEELLGLIKNISDEAKEKQKAVKAEKEQCDKQIDEVNNKINQAKTINDLFKQLSDYQKKSEDLKANAGYIKEIKVKSKNGEKARLVEKDYNDCQDKEKAVTVCTDRIEELHHWIEENTAVVKELELKSESAKAAYDTESPKLIMDIDKINDSLSKYDELEKVQKNLQNTQTNIGSLEEKAKALLEEKDELEAEHKEFYEKFISSQAELLRAQLKDGEPCPVCGSVHHNLEVIHSNDTDSSGENYHDRLEAVDEKIKKNVAAHDACNSELNALKLNEKEYDMTVKALKEQLVYESKETAVEELENKKKALATLETANTQSLQKYQNASKEMDTKNGEYITETKNLEDRRREAAAAKEKYESSLKSQGFSNTEAFKDGLLTEDEINNLNDEVTKHETQTAIVQDNLQRLAAETEGKEPVDTKDLVERKACLQIESGLLIEHSEKLYNIVSVNQESYKKVKSLYDMRNSLSEKYMIITGLHKTANGQYSTSINFQTYIQRRYFAQVIESANKRLYKMSNNQFILKCRDMDNLGKRGNVGLDLDVYSIVNDQVRDVKTLSGGESFVAALAMALGMADIIQDSHGSVHIDTMFIDEGFGSLSDETRNQAIGILNELSEGKRLVGIISHVSELKAQVETKLMVSKTDSGSKTKWEY